MKPKFFVDFDDTLVRSRSIAAKFLLHHYGVKIPVDHDYNGDNLLEFINKQRRPHEQIEETDFWLHYTQELLASHDWHRDAEPTELATTVIPALANQYELWVVTARETSSREVVETLLNRFFPNCFTGVHFVWHFANGEFSGTPKHTFMEASGPGVAFVDDSPHEITRASSVVQSFLFDPHDHHTANQNIPQRVKHWGDIADMFL